MLKKLARKALYTIAPNLAKARAIKRSINRYDMFADENEQFFSSLYLHFIKSRIVHVWGRGPKSILDAGCGQGRLAIPLARMKHRVTGIDLSDKAIESARQYSSKEGLNASFIEGDLESVIDGMEAESFDCIICTEVLYMLDEYEDIIKKLGLLLKKGGLLFLSLRPKLFYIKYFVSNGDFKQAAEMVVNNSGYIREWRLNSLDRQEMIDLMTRNGYSGIETIGIGVLSGITGDPQSKLIEPKNLGEGNRDLLLKMEIEIGKKHCDNGRYVLISGIKN